MKKGGKNILNRYKGQLKESPIQSGYVRHGSHRKYTRQIPLNFTQAWLVFTSNGYSFPREQIAYFRSSKLFHDLCLPSQG